MPRVARSQRLSVVVSGEHKAELEALARRASFEHEADITVSDIVRDAIVTYLGRGNDARLRRLAEEKGRYDVSDSADVLG